MTKRGNKLIWNNGRESATLLQGACAFTLSPYVSVKSMKKELGQFVVVDRAICHGKPTFRGTRILVSDVLEQVADGLSWDVIERQWRGAVSQEAIAEAVRLARQALLDHVPKWAEPAEA